MNSAARKSLFQEQVNPKPGSKLAALILSYFEYKEDLVIQKKTQNKKRKKAVIWKLVYFCQFYIKIFIKLKKIIIPFYFKTPKSIKYFWILIDLDFNWESLNSIYEK